MTINVDFTKGSVNSFSASGSPTYNSDGVSFTVSQGGDAPQLTSIFYIMFGRVEITMKAAPGAGIVSSLVLESDDLDEIDMEWLGAEANEMQSNYFGKGQTTTYNRGQFHTVEGTQSDWITYTVDWTQDRIEWIAGGTVLRTLTYGDAETNQYPQTPMRVKFGSWAGGDPNYNAPGTVAWAEGPVDYSKGPFTMEVQKITISDYSTGKEYKYSDTSGSWQSIEAVDGKINGNYNSDDSVTVTASAEGSTATAPISVPVGGIPQGTTTAVTETGWPWVATGTPSSQTTAPDSDSGGSTPSGWTMSSDGKIVPTGGAAAPSRAPHSALLAAFSVGAGVLVFAGRLL
jgi:beta-glucanase (GH16 family)